MPKKALTKKRPLRPDSPMDSPAHERGEGAMERRKEYGAPKKRRR